jgi:chitin-binding protein
VLPNLRLAAGSTLIDKGVNVGLPYSGSAPDLGAFETSTSPTVSTSQTSSKSPSTPASSKPPSSAPPASSGARGCTATYQLTGSWSGGFQGAVNVINSGPTTIGGWTVGLTLPTGQTVTQLWNAGFIQSGTQLAVTDAGWNGTLTPSATATFGFLADGDGSRPPTIITCTAA